MHGDAFLQETLGAMDMVFSLARRLTRDHGAAEDLVQETYLRAYEAWTKQRRPDRVEPWLATICLNVARSEFRRRSRRPAEILDANAGAFSWSPSDTEEEAIRGVRSEIVQRAMMQLPEEQRIAIALVDLCGFTASEVAKIMRSPRGTVLSRVHRGRKALAAKVKKEAPHGS